LIKNTAQRRRLEEEARGVFGDSFNVAEAKIVSIAAKLRARKRPRYNKRGTMFVSASEEGAQLNGRPMIPDHIYRIDPGQIFDIASTKPLEILSLVYPYREVLTFLPYAGKKVTKDKPLVSLVIIAKDIENYIDHCVSSCCIQTYANVEVVIVVDKSKDETASRAQAWAAMDRRVKSIVLEKATGPNGARKIGIRAASGSYLMLLDGDDWINEDAIELLVESATRQGADCVAFGFDHHNDRTREMWDQVLPTSVIVQEGPLFYSKEPHWALGVANLNHTVWMYFFSSALKHVALDALLDATLYEDLPYFLGLIEHANKTTIFNSVLYHYRRERIGQVTQNWTKVPAGRKVAALEVAFNKAFDAMRSDRWFYQLILLYKIERIYLFERRVCRHDGDVEGVLAWDRSWIRLLARFPEDIAPLITYPATQKRFIEARRPLKRAIIFNRRAKRLRNPK